MNISRYCGSIVFSASKQKQCNACECVWFGCRVPHFTPCDLWPTHTQHEYSGGMLLINSGCGSHWHQHIIELPSWEYVVGVYTIVQQNECNAFDIPIQSNRFACGNAALVCCILCWISMTVFYVAHCSASDYSYRERWNYPTTQPVDVNTLISRVPSHGLDDRCFQYNWANTFKSDNV